MTDQPNELDQKVSMDPAVTLAKFISHLDKLVFPGHGAKVFLYSGTFEDPDLKPTSRPDLPKSVALYAANNQREYYAVNKEKISKLGPIGYRSLAICAAHEVRHRLQRRARKKISYGFWAKLKKTNWATQHLKIKKICYVDLLFLFLTNKSKKEADCHFIEDLIRESKPADWQTIVEIVTI